MDTGVSEKTAQMIAQVVIDITHSSIDRPFDYLIPESLAGQIEVGTPVRVPFGNGNHLRKGVVVALTDHSQFEALKQIDGIVTEARAADETLVSLAVWMRHAYGGTLNQALKTVLPAKNKGKGKKLRTLRLLLDEKEAQEKLLEMTMKRQSARARVLAALMQTPVIDYKLLTEKVHVGRPVIRALEEQGIAVLDEGTQYRDPLAATGGAADAESAGAQSPYRRTQAFYENTPEQAAVLTAFDRHIREGDRRPMLLYGVTGSGKTQVYVEMIRRMVKAGRQAIVLIPEIALTYQVVSYFYGLFGGRVSILHSRLSAAEREDQMQRARSGELDVMIGPRSALFTPLEHLGLIIIDEEHEPAYKSGQVPRYHARETAEKLAQLTGSQLVIGSATPSLEAFYRAEKKEYDLQIMRTRVNERPLPSVRVLDLSAERRKGNRSLISDDLKAAIEERIKQDEQVILFLNRRGWAGFVTCQECGHVVKCPHCDVALSLHKNGRMICHYCGYETDQMHTCPECGSEHIGGVSIGTQQVEDELAALFPDAGVLRMDADATRGKEGHGEVLSAFADGKAQILIGTQMIVKGHDFPRVTLVGVLLADMSLYASDYRSGERTFQLLTQAAGRAGRGERAGEVIIQTYSPDHYAIRHAAYQDYDGFYREEIAFRSMLGYPPVCHLLGIMLTGEDEENLERAADYLSKFAKRIGKESFQIIGPTVPYIGKIKDLYRRSLYIKNESYSNLIRMKDYLEQYIQINKGYDHIQVYFDFDPVES